MPLFSAVVLNVLSGLATILLRKRGLLALLQLCCGCMCYVSLPRGAVGWSAVFVCCFFWYTYSFSFCGPIYKDQLVELLHDEHAHSPIIGGLSAEIEHDIQSVVLHTSQVHNFQKLKDTSLKADNFLATETKVTCLSETVFFHPHIPELPQFSWPCG